MRAVDEWAIDSLRMPRFPYAIVASIFQSRDTTSFDGVQLHPRPEFSPNACSGRKLVSVWLNVSEFAMTL